MKRALILCNGRPPEKTLFREYRAKANLFIAADGGGNVARDLSARPDLVIGDLDSYNKTETDSLEIIYEPDQSTNDLEKALAYAQGQEVTHVDILGATGLRVDQTLKNMSVLKQFNEMFKQLVMIDNYGIIRLIPPSFNIELPVGTTVSLFPLSGRVEGIVTKGLKYQLNGGAMENGVRDGSSNEVVANPVEISHRDGDLLMFISHKKFGNSL